VYNYIMNTKTLVVYYSYEGNTEKIAQAIAKEIGAATLRLRPKKEMQSTGFSKYLWGGKQVFMKSKPDLESFDVDFSEYAQVFIGTPVWSFSYAPAIRTFMDSGLLSGKQVYFFSTHEGGPGKVEMRAKKLVEKANQWMGAKDFRDVAKDTDACLAEALEWVHSLTLV
jgi:flavodoxin